MKILIFPNGPVVTARSRPHDHPDDGAARYQSVVHLHGEFDVLRRKKQVDLRAEADGPDPLAEPQLVAFRRERRDPADEP
jgi:hypothetical protein